MSNYNAFAKLDIPDSPYWITLNGLPDGDEEKGHYNITLWAKTGDKSVMEVGKLQHLRIPRSLLDTDAGKANILQLCGDWLTQPITVWNRTKIPQKHTPTHSQWLADFDLVDEFKEKVIAAAAALALPATKEEEVPA